MIIVHKSTYFQNYVSYWDCTAGKLYTPHYDVSSVCGCVSMLTHIYDAPFSSQSFAPAVTGSASCMTHTGLPELALGWFP